MALFDVITGLGSLYGGIQADNERRRAMNQAAMLRQQGLDQMAKSLEMANVNYQQRLQSGAYDPTKEMQAAGQQSALNFRNALGSRMTNLANLGYRKGDSPIFQQGARLSEDAMLADRLQQLAIQNQYRDRQMAEQNYLNQMRTNLGNTQAGFGQQMYGQELPMQGMGLAGALQGIVGGGLTKGMGETLGGRTKSTVGSDYIKRKGTEQVAKDIGRTLGRVRF
jgi:hypothetical protein